jgi:putative iron-only hydrogenase system regulator
MEQRLGFISILIEDRKKSIAQVNAILSDYGDHIIARMGVPYKERQCNVISLIVDMTTDEIGAVSGKLGSLEGVTVKSALAKANCQG